MPSKSKAEHRMMAAKCTGNSTMKGGPSKKVACEFMHADKGLVKHMPARASKKGK
jgi:hypothetical protein